MNILRYLFEPNPAHAFYSSPKAATLLIACLVILLFGIIFRYYRKRTNDPIFKKLSKSWSTASIWFGASGMFLVVCRVERIAIVAMRFWWIIWLAALLVYLFIQVKLYKMRYYKKVAVQKIEDPRSKYLPKKKNR